MKNPLNYQVTEYDCGPTTLLNGISFLFSREKISPEVIKCITAYSLDSYNYKGEAHKNGTSGMAMRFISSWLNSFGKVKKAPIYTEFVQGEDVNISQNSILVGCIQQGGVVVAKVLLGCWHYVLITGIEGDYIYIFDPYYRKVGFKSDKITMIKDAPTKWNRKVHFSVFNSEEKIFYAFGKKQERECLLMYNLSSRRTENQIEYII